MRKITVQTFISLDGVMQAPGGPDEDRDGGFEHGGWTFNYWDDKMGEIMGAAMMDRYDMMLGRRTYDIFAAHWPNADDPVTTPKFNAATKYVLTHRPESLAWENSVAIGTDFVASVAEIKATDGPDIAVMGSCSLIQLLLEHDLVDKLDLWTFPLVLGSGKKLFGAGARPLGLKLDSVEASTTGVTVARYEKGDMKAAGSFALDQV